jgi:hypothetical protein
LKSRELRKGKKREKPEPSRQLAQVFSSGPSFMSGKPWGPDKKRAQLSEQNSKNRRTGRIDLRFYRKTVA